MGIVFRNNLLFSCPFARMRRKISKRSNLVCTFARGTSISVCFYVQKLYEFSYTWVIPLPHCAFGMLYYTMGFADFRLCSS